MPTIDSVFLCDRDADGVITGSPGRVWRGLGRSLGLTGTVGSSDHEGIFAGLRVPVVDVLPPGVNIELAGEAGVVPGLAAVGRDLDAFDAAVGCPGDAADRGLAAGELVGVVYGIDTGLRLDRALL